MAVFASPNAAPAVSRLDHHLRLALTAALTIGYTVLFAAAVYPLPFLPVVVLAAAYGYLRFWRPRPPLLSERGWTVVTTALVLAPLALALTRRMFLVDALDTILLALPLIKYYTARRDRDYLQIIGLAFGQIIYATVVNFEISFGLAAAAFMAAAMWSLVLLSFRKGVLTHGAHPRVIQRTEKAVFRRRYLAFIGLLTPLALVLMAGIFLIIPRPGSALANFSFGIHKRVSGFSDRVDFGELGEIKLDPSVAMRVRLDAPPFESPLYWRGAVLERFDGLTWTARRFRGTAIKARPGNFYSILNVDPQTLVKQTFYLDGLDTNYLLHAGFPAAVQAQASPLILHASGSLSLGDRPAGLASYAVWSMPENPLKLQPRQTSSLLQLPPNLDPRLAALARETVGDAERPEEKARRLEKHLQDAYTYSLEAGLLPSADPIAHFLFESKTGHCEYFASAMVLMLRTLDIPARLVTGYQQGEWVESAGYFLVRQSDAHAWVEAFVGDRWRRYDPTPAAGWETHARNAWSFVSGFVDSLAFNWQRYVIFFSMRDQLQMLFAADRDYHHLRALGLGRWLSLHADWLLLPLVGAAALIAWSRRRAMASFFSRSPKEAQRLALSRRWGRLVRLMRGAGLPLLASVTPAELAALAGERYPAVKADLDGWRGVFEPIRFGGHALTAAAAARLDLLERRIRRGVKRRTR
ncbi:MAG: DUF3488 domain-containing protein [Myxococcales bacterium]|nr:MAG: DUF3488 domain-containing protein [Myxococcales bacterium]